MKAGTACQFVSVLAADLAVFLCTNAALSFAVPTSQVLLCFLLFALPWGLYQFREGKPLLDSLHELRALCLSCWFTTLCMLPFAGSFRQTWVLALALPLFLLLGRRTIRQLLHLPSHPLVVQGELASLQQPLSPCHPALQCVKLCSDYLLAPLLLLLCLPLFALLATLIKLTSAGPVLYFSWRLGKDGKPFKLIKFRTMSSQAEASLQQLMAESPQHARHWKQHFKLEEDPRITQLGSFLRKTSLDELPQLWNVLCGDMALIGPRPIIEEERPLYGEHFQTFASVKPGITGLWQVSGRNDLTYPQRVRLDVFYIRHWSPWLDLEILLKTITEILTAHGR